MWWIALIIVVIIIGVYRANEYTAKKEKFVSIQEDYIAKKKITVTSDYRFDSMVQGTMIRFIADNVRKKIYIFETDFNLFIYDYSSIIGCDILINSEVAGGVRRAVVGGVIAGGAGAVVGAVTASKKVQSCKLVLYFDDVSSPRKVITVITKETKTSDNDYIKAMDFMSSINASIKAIISNSKRSEHPKSQQPQIDGPNSDR